MALAAAAAVIVVARPGRRPRPAAAPAIALGTAPRLVPAAPPPAGAPDATMPVVRLEAASGDVSVVADGASAPVRAGHVLAAGEGVSVGGDHGRATVVVDPGGRLELAGATALGPPAPGASGVAIPVLAGRVHADLRARAAGALALGTPLGELRAAGPARFRVDVRPEETRVEVHQGTLRLTAYASGRHLDLGAGALAVLAPDRDPQVERLEPPAPVVFDLQVGPRELPVLRRMPPAFLKYLTGWPIDDAGLLAPSREGFRCSSDQRHGLPRMAIGAALDRKSDIDEAWRVIDATMAYQAPDGSFLDAPECDADWQAEVAHVLLVLMESEWERAYRPRINALLSQLRRTATYLAEPAQVAALERAGAVLSRRYVVEAAAFAYSGLLFDDARMVALGRDFLDRMLHQQRDDGAYLIHDGTDSSYQGVILEHLGWLVVRFPDARAEASFRRGMDWMRGRLGPNGELDIRGNTRTGPSCRVSDCQGIDWQRMARALLYYAAWADARSMFDLTQKFYWRKRTITD